MCRAIKTLHNFSPPATNDEIRASSLQFVRKLSGFTKPSRANEEAFNRAVDEVAHAAHHLLESLVTNALTAESRSGSVESENAIGKEIWDSQDRRGLTNCPQICADLRKLQKQRSSQKICVNLRNLRVRQENSFSTG